MAVALGRSQSVCTSRGGATKRSAYEAWFALNRRAYQAVLNVAIQAEMNMTSADVTSRRRRDDDVFSHELHSSELVTSVNKCLPAGKSFCREIITGTS